MQDDLVKRISINRARAREIENELCGLLQEAAQLACDDGYISRYALANAVAPKERRA